MSKNDFVPWKDVDLDYCLGQYTDTDDTNQCHDISSSDLSDHESLPPAKKAKKAKKSDASEKNSVCYVCPHCMKELKTIGGFRGHVTKQHNSPHLKGN